MQKSSKYGLFSLELKDEEKKLYCVDIAPISVSIVNNLIRPPFLPVELLDPFDTNWARLKQTGLYSVYLRVISLRLKNVIKCTLGELFAGALMDDNISKRTVILPSYNSVETLFLNVLPDTAFDLENISCGVQVESVKNLQKDGGFFFFAAASAYDAGVYFPAEDSPSLSGNDIKPLLLVQKDKSKELINRNTGALTKSTQPLSDQPASASKSIEINYRKCFSGLEVVVEWISNTPLRNKEVKAVDNVFVVVISDALGPSIDTIQKNVII